MISGSSFAMLFIIFCHLECHHWHLQKLEMNNQAVHVLLTELMPYEASEPAAKCPSKIHDALCTMTTMPSSVGSSQLLLKTFAYDESHNLPEVAFHPSRGPPNLTSLENGHIVAPNKRIGVQNPTTRAAAKTGRAYDRRFTRFWRRFEGKQVGEWNVESVNRRLAAKTQPDLVLVNNKSKVVKVVDLTSQEAPSHLTKGQRYLDYFEKKYPGYELQYQETYWKNFTSPVEALDRNGNLYFPE